MITDTHIHIDRKEYNSIREEMLNRSRKVGIERFIIPTVDSNKVSKIVELSENNNDIYFAIGHHSNTIEKINDKNITDLISHKKCIAIGECGLDWFRIKKGINKNEEKKRQIKLLKQQIFLSMESNKPLILHTRGAEKEIAELLYEYNNLKGVIHCYVGSKELLRLIEKGFYFGIGGVLTYKSAKDLKKNIKKIPIDKLVLETDGPFLTPEPYRKKINESSYIPIILNELSNILGKNKIELEKIIEENTNRLFNLS